MAQISVSERWLEERVVLKGPGNKPGAFPVEAIGNENVFSTDQVRPVRVTLYSRGPLTPNGQIDDIPALWHKADEPGIAGEQCTNERRHHVE